MNVELLFQLIINGLVIGTLVTLTSVGAGATVVRRAGGLGAAAAPVDDGDAGRQSCAELRDSLFLGLLHQHQRRRDARPLAHEVRPVLQQRL